MPRNETISAESQPVLATIPTNEPQDDKPSKIEHIATILIINGNSLATTGNTLLYFNNLIPLTPALCFTVENIINVFINSGKLYNTTFKNQKFDVFLTITNFMTLPLIPYAVFTLNWPTLDPELVSVWSRFIAFAVLSSVIHGINISEAFCRLTDTKETKPSIFRRSLKFMTNILAPLSVAAAIDGVWNFWTIKNSHPHNFMILLSGLGAIGLGLTINGLHNICNLFYGNKNSTTNVEDVYHTEIAREAIFDVTAINNSTTITEFEEPTTSSFSNLRAKKLSAIPNI